MPFPVDPISRQQVILGIWAAFQFWLHFVALGGPERSEAVFIGVTAARIFRVEHATRVLFPGSACFRGARASGERVLPARSVRHPCRTPLCILHKESFAPHPHLRLPAKHTSRAVLGQ